MKEDFGMACKEGDSVGVLVQFNKNKEATLTMYRNNVGMGVCFKNVKGEVRPVFGIGSEGQISLDTRAQVPIDSYRHS